MNALKAFGLAWAALLLNATWFQIAGLRSVAPNLVLVVLVCVAVAQGSRNALLVGALIGFVEDVVYGPFLGLSTFTYGAVGYFASVLAEQFLQRNLLITFLVTSVLTFAQEWFDYGLTQMLGVTALSARLELAQSLWDVVMNGVALLLLYPVLLKWLQPKKRSRYAEDTETAG
jgi:rod shape-determining protein MreD